MPLRQKNLERDDLDRERQSVRREKNANGEGRA
jgi:hypothetical protein